MSSAMDEHEALEATVQELRTAKSRLEKQRDEIVGQINEKDRVLRFWEARLAGLNGTSEGKVKHRLRKGEPLRRIKDAYDTAKPGIGLSVAELAEKTSMTWSTVRATLNRNPERFKEGDGGLWHRKDTTK